MLQSKPVESWIWGTTLLQIDEETLEVTFDFISIAAGLFWQLQALCVTVSKQHNSCFYEVSLLKKKRNWRYWSLPNIWNAFIVVESASTARKTLMVVYMPLTLTDRCTLRLSCMKVIKLDGHASFFFLFFHLSCVHLFTAFLSLVCKVTHVRTSSHRILSLLISKWLFTSYI